MQGMQSVSLMFFKVVLGASIVLGTGVVLGLGFTGLIRLFG